MSGRPTADLVTALDSALGWVMRPPHERDLLSEVRDRLTQLDAAISDVQEIITEACDRIPCLDPGVPWDALGAIRQAVRAVKP